MEDKPRKSSDKNVLHWLSTLILLTDDVQDELEQMQVYDSSGDVTAVLFNVVNHRGACHPEACYSFSAASIKIGDYTMQLNDIRVEKSMESLVAASRPPDVQLKITIRSAECMSLISLHNVTMTGIIDISGIHVLHVQVAECKLIGGKEEMALWKSISESHSLDNTATPFAKIFAMPCCISMAGVIQAASSSPLNSVKEYEGTEASTLGSLLKHYSSMFFEMIQHRLLKSAELAADMSDGIAASLGCVALSASIATPIGLAASLVAVGVKDSISNAASAGKQSRGEASDAKYQFGDVTRGMVASFRQDKNALLQDDQETKPVESVPKNSVKSRYAAIGGSSVGAVVGLTLIGGPIGLLAGSFIGGTTVKRVMKKSDSVVEVTDDSNKESNENVFEQDIELPPPVDATGEGEGEDEGKGKVAISNDDNVVASVGIVVLQEPQTIATTATTAITSQETTSNKYGLGKLTQDVVARGKKAANRDEAAPYKFGDFTRGLFS